MRKRKPVMVSKHARSSRIAAANRTPHVVRSSKSSFSPSIGGVSSPEPPSTGHNDLHDEEALLLQKPEPVENSENAFQVNTAPMTHNELKDQLDFFAPNANVMAYHAKLLEIAQANMQFALECAQRLASIRSPVEFPGIVVEFTSKRIAMFRKHSTEMAQLSTRRWTS